jgi:hypothetical protein
MPLRPMRFAGQSRRLLCLEGWGVAVSMHPTRCASARPALLEDAGGIAPPRDPGPSKRGTVLGRTGGGKGGERWEGR